MSDPVVPVLPVVPVVPVLSPEEVSDLSRLFPFRNEFRDNKEGAALRERFLPVCFAEPLKAFNEYQIKAIPKGWIVVKNLDGEVVGACYPNVIYSDDKSRNVVNETFKIELTSDQKIAALEQEEAKELAALMARMAAKKQAVLDAAKLTAAIAERAAAAAADPLIAAVAERAARPPA